MTALTVTLPWPDPSLSPNSRLHWAALNRAKQAAHLDGQFATKEALAGAEPTWPQAALPMRITFYPPDRRRRDRDNAIASLKAYLDGMSAALGVNDYHFRPEFAWAEPEKPGRVVVELVGLPERAGKEQGE